MDWRKKRYLYTDNAAKIRDKLLTDIYKQLVEIIRSLHFLIESRGTLSYKFPNFRPHECQAMILGSIISGLGAVAAEAALSVCRGADFHYPQSIYDLIQTIEQIQVIDGSFGYCNPIPEVLNNNRQVLGHPSSKGYLTDEDLAYLARQGEIIGQMLW